MIARQSLEHARLVIDQLMLRRQTEGLPNDVDRVDAAATEDGNGALIYVHLADGETLYATVDFAATIDPARFDGERLVECFLALSAGTIH